MPEDEQAFIKEQEEQKQMRDEDYLYEAAERREIWMELWQSYQDNN